MRLFVRRDLDGFFGLFVDNLVQLLLIVGLCGGLCGMTGDDAHLLYFRILPGAAISILVGNLFFAWQAHRVARREGRDDVTALPYGINTVSLLVHVFFVIAPVYRETHDAELAWKMGLLACLGSGVIELLGAFVAEQIRKRSPRAALLSTLAGIAIGFIAMTFALRIWTWPLVAMVPTAIVLVTYFGRIRFPLGLPGGLVAVAAGTMLAWLLPGKWSGLSMDAVAVTDAWSKACWSLPRWSGAEIWSVFQLPPHQWLRFFSVIIPMGLFNVIGSLQNIESAEAGGDKYDTGASLAVNGAGTIVAALFGSCFPTTLYIGHPGWKAMGARAGYSTLNGLVITILCLTGSVGLIASLVPMEAGIAIVLWIGVVITAQAFQATPRTHAPAVAVGLFPAIAAWGATVMFGTIQSAGGRTLQDLMEGRHAVEVAGFLVHGLIVLERGYIFTCMILAAVSACLIDRRLYAAAVWSLLGALVTYLGLAHAYQVSGNSVDFLLIGGTVRQGALAYHARELVLGYALMAMVFILIGLMTRRQTPVD